MSDIKHRPLSIARLWLEPPNFLPAQIKVPNAGQKQLKNGKPNDVYSFKVYLGNKKVRFTPRKPYDLLVNRTENTDWRARPDLNRRSPP